MAERRMFAKTIIDSDAFLDMPQSSQLLYFHLSMRADDDGFINNPKSIMRNAKCNDDDIKLLITKKFIIPFESGIVVIKHWKIHNYIAKDRYKETKYKEERALLSLDENNSYTRCIQAVHECETQDRLGKGRIEEDNINYIIEDVSQAKTPPKRTTKKFVPPSLEDVIAYCNERGNNVDAQRFIDYYSANGWKVGRNAMKDWKAAVRTWEKNGYSNGSTTDTSGNPFYDMYLEAKAREGYDGI
jgi:hypothetical protein